MSEIRGARHGCYWKEKDRPAKPVELAGCYRVNPTREDLACTT